MAIEKGATDKLLFGSHRVSVIQNVPASRRSMSENLPEHGKSGASTNSLISTKLNLTVAWLPETSGGGGTEWVFFRAETSTPPVGKQKKSYHF